MADERHDGWNDHADCGQPAQSEGTQELKVPEQSFQDGCGQPVEAPSWAPPEPGTPTANIPEPPLRWSEDASSYMQPNEGPSFQVQQPAQTAIGTGVIGKTRFTLKGEDLTLFKSGRVNLITSIVTAVASLFIGGALLSCVSLVFAFLTNSKFETLAATRSNEPDAQHALRRSGKIAILVAALALVFNIIALVYLYPIIMDSMQTGSLGSLAGTPSAPETGGGSSTWG